MNLFILILLIGFMSCDKENNTEPTDEPDDELQKKINCVESK